MAAKVSDPISAAFYWSAHSNPAPEELHLLIWEAVCTYREGEAWRGNLWRLVTTEFALWFLSWLSVFSLWLLLRFYFSLWCSAILLLNIKIKTCVYLSGLGWDIPVHLHLKDSSFYSLWKILIIFSLGSAPLYSLPA